MALSRIQAKKNIIILVKNDYIEDKPNVLWNFQLNTKVAQQSYKDQPSLE